MEKFNNIINPMTGEYFTSSNTRTSYKDLQDALKELQEAAKNWADKKKEEEEDDDLDIIDCYSIDDDLEYVGCDGSELEIEFTPEEDLLEDKEPEIEPVNFPTFDEFFTKSDQIFFDKKKYDSSTWIYRKEGMIVGYICDIDDKSYAPDDIIHHEYIAILLKKPVKYFGEFDDEKDTICDYEPVEYLEEAEDDLKQLYIEHYLMNEIMERDNGSI